MITRKNTIRWSLCWMVVMVVVVTDSQVPKTIHCIIIFISFGNTTLLEGVTEDYPMVGPDATEEAFTQTAEKKIMMKVVFGLCFWRFLPTVNVCVCVKYRISSCMHESVVIRPPGCIIGTYHMVIS